MPEDTPETRLAMAEEIRALHQMRTRLQHYMPLDQMVELSFEDLWEDLQRERARANATIPTSNGYIKPFRLGR